MVCLDSAELNLFRNGGLNLVLFFPINGGLKTLHSSDQSNAKTQLANCCSKEESCPPGVVPRYLYMYIFDLEIVAGPIISKRSYSLKDYNA